MKIFLKLPSGAEFRLEQEPMSEARFNALCCLAAGAMALALLLNIVWAV